MKYTSIVRGIVTVAALLATHLALAGDSAPTFQTYTGIQDSGAYYEIAMPLAEEWNGGLLIFAHGYVEADEPLEIPSDQYDFGNTSLPQVLTDYGYAFATTSYSVNGLAVKEGLDDVRDLLDIFAEQFGAPDPVYIAGVSMGGLVATLAVEQYPEEFDGGICACGPIGDFNVQTSWYGDFRVVFDYFFRDLLPGDANNVPEELFADWENVYKRTVRPRVFRLRNIGKLKQLVKVTGIPIDPDRRLGSLEDSIQEVLYGHVRSTADGIEKLGGVTFENEEKVYEGSKDDAKLNAQVERFDAQTLALAEVSLHYQTSGNLDVPLVTMHTTLDPQVPYKHINLYRTKTILRGNPAEQMNLRVERYGHCNFTEREALTALALLIARVEGPGAVLPIALDGINTDKDASVELTFDKSGNLVK